jgi:hypothetical protein
MGFDVAPRLSVVVRVLFVVIPLSKSWEHRSPMVPDASKARSLYLAMKQS